MGAPTRIQAVTSSFVKMNSMKTATALKGPVGINSKYDGLSSRDLGSRNTRAQAFPIGA